MNDKRWITKNGYRILINNYAEHQTKQDTNNYMNNKLKQSVSDKELEKEATFHKKYYMEDGDYMKEFTEQNKDNSGAKYWDEKEQGYDFEGNKGLFEKRIDVRDKKTGEIVGSLKYKDIHKPENYVRKDKIQIDSITVDKKYRRQGIATQMYKEVQRRAGDRDIYFGELTVEGKKLVEHIGKITKKEGNIYPDYWGRINL